MYTQDPLAGEKREYQELRRHKWLAGCVKTPLSLGPHLHWMIHRGVVLRQTLLHLFLKFFLHFITSIVFHCCLRHSIRKTDSVAVVDHNQSFVQGFYVSCMCMHFCVLKLCSGTVLNFVGLPLEHVIIQISDSFKYLNYLILYQRLITLKSH